MSYVRVPGISKVTEVAFYDGEDHMMERNLNVVDSKKVVDQGVFNFSSQEDQVPHGYRVRPRSHLPKEDRKA